MKNNPIKTAPAFGIRFTALVLVAEMKKGLRIKWLSSQPTDELSSALVNKK